MGHLRTCELLLSLCQCVGAAVVAPLKRGLSAKLTGGLKNKFRFVTDLNIRITINCPGARLIKICSRALLNLTFIQITCNALHCRSIAAEAINNIKRTKKKTAIDSSINGIFISFHNNYCIIIYQKYFCVNYIYIFRM